MELDFYGGYRGSFAGDWSVALGYYDTSANASTYTNAHGHHLGRATAVPGLARSF